MCASVATAFSIVYNCRQGIEETWAAMTLYYEERGEGTPLVLVHGLFGSATNWRGVARELARDYRVISVDLPNHGRSDHADSMTYEYMAAALHAMTPDWGGGPMAWVGHSMGGKAVMSLALTWPEDVHPLVVVDIAPVGYQSGHMELVDAMLGLNLGMVTNRSEAEQLLVRRIPDTPTRLFLLQNLVYQEGGLKWRLNLDAIRDNMAQIMGFPEYSDAVYSGPALFLRGANSDYISDSGARAITRLFPNAGIETVDHAGHWVHADQPKRVSQAIRLFLSGHS